MAFTNLTQRISRLIILGYDQEQCVAALTKDKPQAVRNYYTRFKNNPVPETPPQPKPPKEKKIRKNARPETLPTPLEIRIKELLSLGHSYDQIMLFLKQDKQVAIKAAYYKITGIKPPKASPEIRTLKQLERKNAPPKQPVWSIIRKQWILTGHCIIHRLTASNNTVLGRIKEANGIFEAVTFADKTFTIHSHNSDFVSLQDAKEWIEQNQILCTTK